MGGERVVCLLMRKLTIEARSLESARRFLGALSDFKAELVEAGDTYLIPIELSNDAEIVSVLNAIENTVGRRSRGAAVLDLDGRRYAMRTGLD